MFAALLKAVRAEAHNGAMDAMREYERHEVGA